MKQFLNAIWLSQKYRPTKKVNPNFLVVGFYRNPLKCNESESVKKLNKLFETLIRKF